MIMSFKKQGTEDVLNGRNTKQARILCPQTLWNIAAKKLDQLDSAQSVDEMRIPPGNQLELLSGDRTGQWSFRINDQYRICFKWLGSDPEEVEITDCH